MADPSRCPLVKPIWSAAARRRSGRRGHFVVPRRLNPHSANDPPGVSDFDPSLRTSPRLNKAASSRRTSDWLKEMRRLNDLTRGWRRCGVRGGIERFPDDLAGRGNRRMAVPGPFVL